MKKVFAIILIVCLAVGVAFAAEKGDFKVGGQLGYGGDFISLKYDSNNYTKTSNGGFYFAALADYALTDEISVKAEMGLNTMGKAKTSGKLLGISADGPASESSPIQFSIYAGAAYNINVSKEFTLQAGAGLDMMIGKLSKDDDAKTNAAIGLGFEFGGEYEVAKNVGIIFGGRFGWHFINTNEDIDDAITAADDNDVKVGHTSFKAYAGVSYSL